MRWVLAIVLSSPMLAQSSPPSSRPQPPDLRIEIDRLKKEVAELRKDSEINDTLRNSISNEVSTLQKYAFANLSTSSPGGYSRLDTNIGILLVSLKSVEPYLDGYKVALEIGNLSTATCTSYTVSAAWGPRSVQTLNSKNFRTYNDLRRRAEFERSDSLAPSRWNPVELIFPTTKPDGIAFVELTIDVKEVSLARPK